MPFASHHTKQTLCHHSNTLIFITKYINNNLTCKVFRHAKCKNLNYNLRARLHVFREASLATTGSLNPRHKGACTPTRGSGPALLRNDGVAACHLVEAA